MRKLISLLLLSGGLTLGGQALAIQDLDRIVAVVDEDVVVASELEREMQGLIAKAQRAGQALPPLQVIREKTLERLVLIKLQVAAAKRAGLNVDAETLNQAIRNVAQRNRLTLAELRQALAADGIPFDLYRSQLETEILMSRLRSREVLNRIQITDDEIDAYLAQEAGASSARRAVRLGHILIAVPEGASDAAREQARAKAQALLDRLREGADFGNLARAESDGRQAANGGDLGWMKADQVPSLFSRAVQTLALGEVAGPLRSGSGFHLVQLTELQGGERAVIKQTHARHILITPNELTSDRDALTRLEQLRERIVGGDDFATLARSHSDDKGSAIQGGDLGWTSPGDLVPAFEETLNKLALNEVSQPVRTQFGWHLIQVLERRDYDATNEVRRNKAREALRDRKAKDATRHYLQRLRSEAYVDIRLGELE